MSSFALTRGVLTDNRRANIPSSEVTHVPVRGGCESGFAIADADDSDSERGPQPTTTIVSNAPNAVLRFSIALTRLNEAKFSDPAHKGVRLQPARRAQSDESGSAMAGFAAYGCSHLRARRSRSF